VEFQKIRKHFMPTNNQPKVSVCIPTYNYAHYISDAIESVLSQSFTDFELIVVDNCSSDNTPEVVNKYVRRDGRINYFVNKENLGFVNNFNECLRHASGEYVKILSADDLISPTCIERSVEILNRYPEVAFIGSARALVDCCLRPIRIISYADKFDIVEGFSVVRRCLINGVNYIGEPTAVVFRRQYAARGFDTAYKQLVDLEMWFHLLEQGKFAYVNEPLCSVRIHKDQQTNLNIGQLIHLDEPFMLMNGYSNKPYVNLSRLLKSYISYITAYRLLKSSKRKQISFQVAVSKINEHYGIGKILGLYPFYKIYKLYLRRSQGNRSDLQS
jgi:glycosyltransferase involved in cell wall biosynthesis